MRRLVTLGSIAVSLGVLVLVLSTATLLDRRPPGIERVSLTLTAGAGDRAQSLSAIDVEFDEPVDHASVEGRFRIEPFVAGAISWNGSTATFTPTMRLPPATRFTIRIEPGFTDLAGNVASGGLDRWEFTTVGGPTSRVSD
jgi:hypothetical protein